MTKDTTEKDHEKTQQLTPTIPKDRDRTGATLSPQARPDTVNPKN